MPSILPVDQCYYDASVFNVSVALFIIIGTFISYLPQYIAIYRRKSSDGINYVMLGIALACSFFTAINSGILKWQQVVCCLNLNGLQCLKNNLATLQLMTGLLCYAILFGFFLKYMPLTPTATKDKRQLLRERRNAWIVLVFVVSLSLCLGIIAGVMYYDLHFSGEAVEIYGKVLGIISSILMLIQWTPQIWTTFKQKSAGSLSVVMLLLQMPGALLVMFFQAFLNSADVTTWGPYLFQFIQQFILVVMCLVFKVQKRRREKDSERQSLIYDEESFTVPLDK